MTNTIICAICGGAGHITSDCKSAKSKDSSVAGTSSSANDDGSSSPAAAERPATWAEREKMDSEYHSLMAELGQGPAVDAKSAKSGTFIHLYINCSILVFMYFYTLRFFIYLIILKVCKKN